MLKFTQSSFLTDEKGNPAPRKLGTRGDSQFYAATGKYHIFNTCNKWTAKALYSAGLDIGTSFKFTTASIMSYLDNESLSRKVGQGIAEPAP
jgi:hypothetical protein